MIIASSTNYYRSSDGFGESGGVVFYKLTPLSCSCTTEFLEVELVRGDTGRSSATSAVSTVRMKSISNYSSKLLLVRWEPQDDNIFEIVCTFLKCV